MNDIPLKFKSGDFVKNKIHGYTSMLYKAWREETNVGWEGLVVETLLGDWATDFIKVGMLRHELSSEVESVPATLELIATAKKHIEEINSYSITIIDNLTYVEILNNLNEKEKTLKNNDKL